jgi:hypothetical protein
MRESQEKRWRTAVADTARRRQRCVPPLRSSPSPRAASFCIPALALRARGTDRALRAVRRSWLRHTASGNCAARGWASPHTCGPVQVRGVGARARGGGGDGGQGSARATPAAAPLHRRVHARASRGLARVGQTPRHPPGQLPSPRHLHHHHHRPHSTRAVRWRRSDIQAGITAAVVRPEWSF